MVPPSRRGAGSAGAAPAGEGGGRERCRSAPSLPSCGESSACLPPSPRVCAPAGSGAGAGTSSCEVKRFPFVTVNGKHARRALMCVLSAARALLSGERVGPRSFCRPRRVTAGESLSLAARAADGAVCLCVPGDRRERGCATWDVGVAVLYRSHLLRYPGLTQQEKRRCGGRECLSPLFLYFLQKYCSMLLHTTNTTSAVSLHLGTLISTCFFILIR